jgi:Sporulation and spore germination
MKQTNISKGVVAAAAAGLLAAGGWTVWKQSAVKVSVETDPNNGTSIKFQPASPSASDTASPIAPSVQISPSSAPVPQTSVDIYKMEPTDKGLKAVPSSIPVKEPTKSAEDNLRDAFKEMLNQKSNKPSGKAGAVSAIPKGTRLLSLKSKQDGVHLDLSKEFTSGGGSSSMQARLAQVVMQATSFDKNANVWISVEGQPLKELGGEGLEVQQPLTRDSVQDMFQSIQTGNN